MIRTTTLLMMFLLFVISSWAQDEKKIIQNGKPIVKVFANFHSSVGEGDNTSEFTVRRVYLGYKADLGDNFSTVIKLDIGSPTDASDFTLSRRFAYFKNAYLQYKKDKFTVRFGVIPTHQFKVQEKIWAHRYIRKTVTDLNRMGSSADIGAYVIYDLNKFISFDAGLLNGEGYGKIQNDNALKAALGATIKPIKGLQLRFYADVVEKGEWQINWVNFISYSWKKKVTAGLEYDMQYNVKNAKDEDLAAVSVFANYYFLKKWQLFARYDLVESSVLGDDNHPWRYEKDGSLIIGGIQYQIHEKVKLALDYQGFVFRDAEKSTENFVFLNVEFKL